MTQSAGSDRKAAGAPDGLKPVHAPFLPWKRLAGAFLAGIPFFCTLPYSIHSWRASPMDRMNWIFHLIFLLIAVCGIPAMMDSAKRVKIDWFALPAVIAAAVVYGTGIIREIHMLRILGGTWFWWTGIWFFCGWPGAWATLPSFAVLTLGSTSSTFLLCSCLLIQPQTALFLKLAAAVLCAAVCGVFLFTDYVMKREVFWFILAAAAILTGTLTSRGNVRTVPTFRPDLTAVSEGLTVTETPLTANLIRFFEGAEVHQYVISDGAFHCSFLLVKCGSDIHKIHPASHCIRSSGAKIMSESVVMHTLSDGRELPVTEIRSNIGGTPVLTLVWYSGPRETTGSFFTFRRKWSSSDQWYSYQIAAETGIGGESAIRTRLLGVLSKLRPL